MTFEKPFSLVALSLIAGGCVFAPTQYGARGIVTPEIGAEQYQKYLDNCRRLSPTLDARCKERGQPAAIKIGASKGCFVWSEPRSMVIVGAFGRTVDSLRIPRDLTYYAGEDPIRAARIAANEARRQTLAASSHDANSNQSARPAAPAYSVEKFERKGDNAFVYEFRVVFTQTNGVSFADAEKVKSELRRTVREDYCAACPDARGESIQIDLPVFSLKDGAVEGRAEVTRIAVVSLKYDDTTQKGVIAVRIGTSSFEKARAWVRKNIESIVRDKNIALTTGKVPEDKRFFLGSERVREGNILELEFEAQ